MGAESGSIWDRRLAERMKRIIAGLAGLGVVGVVLAMVVPITSGDVLSRPGAAGVLEPLPTTRPAPQPLLARMAGTVLIRPAAVQAAVKNDGTAERLLKRLKLQGVVRMGEGMVAYVQVEKEGMKTVREGQSILDFTVDKVETGKVMLSLQGVVVVLDH